jgi:RND family efflux transporter MFP subunit
MSRKRWLIVLACGLGLVGVAIWSPRLQSTPPRDAESKSGQPVAGGPPAPAQPAAMPPTLVVVARAVQRPVRGEHTFVGTIMPKRVSSVGSAVDGRVIDFPTNEGDRVQRGDTLAQLLTGQLDIQLAGAKAEWELRRRALEELEASWPEEVKQAEARYLSRKAALDYARLRQQRARSLHQKDTLSDEMLQEAESLADQAEQAFAEAKSAWSVAQGPRRLAIAQAAQNVAVQEEEVNAIQDQIDKHTIRAPFNGYVVEEFTEIGQWVAKAGLVAKVAELDEVDVEIMVVENFLPALSVGTPALIEVPALQDAGSDFRFQGHVALIVPQADARSRSFPVKVRMQNSVRPDGQLLLKAGMLARVTARVNPRGDAVLVPKDALVLGGPSPVVFTVDDAPPAPVAAGPADGTRQGVVRSVPVELGVEEENMIQIKGGIRPRDRVVVQGNERLRPGMTVVFAEN